jgi:septal ring factor EnvC (AmiA/AmiB activator)
VSATSERNVTKNITKKDSAKPLASRRPLSSDKVVTKNNNILVPQSNEAAISYNNTMMYSGLSRPTTNSNIMAEKVKLRAEIAQYKEKLAELQQEISECQKHNKILETELPELRDEVDQVKNDRETMLTNVEQARVIFSKPY